MKKGGIDEKLPVVTVVTVVFNSLNHIKKTLESVTSQSYPNIEYVVIDGGSTDGTIEYIESHMDGIDKYVSEPDEGIYDAMNKAIRIACGEWIIFMNAGDCFVGTNTVDDVFSRYNWAGTDFIYGEHYWCSENGEKIYIKNKSLKKMWQSISFSHQSLFSRTSIMKHYMFDTAYKVVSDYDFYYKCYKQGMEFYRFDAPISRVASGGYSDLNYITRTIERWKVVRKYENKSMVDRYYLRLVLVYYFDKLAKSKIIPSVKIKKFIRMTGISLRRFKSAVNKLNKKPLMTDGPLVSVIIPNHNNEKYIKKCLSSVQNQTYKNIEIVVVDDASTDRSIEVIKDISDVRTLIIELSKQNGVSAVRNNGINAAKGEYLTTLDGDDVFTDNEKISRELGLVLKYAQKDKKDVVAFSNVCRIGPKDDIVEIMGNEETIVEGNIRDEIYNRSAFIPRDFMCAKKIYIEAGLYDEEIPLYEDWDLKLRISNMCEFYYTGVLGVGYRIRDDGLSAAPAAELEKWRKYIKRKNSLVKNAVING